MAQTRKSTRKKRQTQLSFTPLPSSSPAAANYPEQIARRAASVRYGESPTKKQRTSNNTSHLLSSSPAASPIKNLFQKQKVQVVIHSPSRSVSQLPTPEASSQAKAEDPRDSEGDLSPAKKPEKLGTILGDGSPSAEVKVDTENSDSGLYSSSDDVITPLRNGRRGKVAPIPLSSGEGSDSQDILPASRRNGRHAKDPSAGENVDFSTQNSSQKTPLRLKLRPHNQQSTPRIELSSGESSISPTHKAQGTLLISSGNEVSSEDEVVTPSRRPRNARVSKSTPAQTGSEQDETDNLDDEVADLDENATELRKSRTRGRQDTSERSQRQRKLEELKRRRAGIAVESEDDDEGYSPEDTGESDLESIDHAMRSNDNLDEYENDFLDDDSDDALGVDLGVAGVPLEFTYHANKKPFDHFKTEVEWMVHNKLNPAFDRHDEIYLLAHHKLDKEVGAYGSSQFRSSVWNEKFMNALKTRPDFFRVEVPTMFERKCDACQRSNHPPKHRGIFTGKPYNRDTLETIEHDEDDESDTDEEAASEHSSTEDEESFFLGRFCCANAEMAHALHHWRHSLNQTVLQWLADDGHLTPAKIVERDNLRQKKRQKEANRIVDGMEEMGVMRDMYQKFKENLQAARDAKPRHFSRGH